MAEPSTRRCPYAAVAAVNANYAAFISMSALEPHKAYMMTDFKAIHHPVYGDGFLCFLKGKNNSHWRSQFPPKYLQNFSEVDLKKLRRYITEGKYPFIIFRGLLGDKSFKIELAPHSDELINAHTEWLDVGVIQFSPNTSLDLEDMEPMQTDPPVPPQTTDPAKFSFEEFWKALCQAVLPPMSPLNAPASRKENVHAMEEDVMELIQANQEVKYEEDTSDDEFEFL